MLRTVESESASPPFQQCQDGVRLTGDRYWHVKKRSIPRYDKEYLGDTPFALPDILDFTIEEDQPVVHLVIGHHVWLHKALPLGCGADLP